MVDKQCKCCGDVWDPHYIVHDVGLKFEPSVFVDIEEWSVLFGSSEDGASHGNMEIHRCPSCNSDERTDDGLCIVFGEHIYMTPKTSGELTKWINNLVEMSAKITQANGRKWVKMDDIITANRMKVMKDKYMGEQRRR